MWLKDVDKFAHDCKIRMLIGNKADIKEDRMVPKDKALAFSKCNSINEFLETSAKVKIYLLWLHLDFRNLVMKLMVLLQVRYTKALSALFVAIMFIVMIMMIIIFSNHCQHQHHHHHSSSIITIIITNHHQSSLIITNHHYHLYHYHHHHLLLLPWYTPFGVWN